MFKWVIVFLIIFSGLWIYFKSYTPDLLRKSQFADSINTVLYPLETLIADYDNSFVIKDYKKQMKEVDANQVKNLISRVHTASKYVVFYIFPVDCFSCRIALSSFNRFIPKTEDKIQYFIFAVTDSKEDYNILLNQYAELNFKPYILDANSISAVKAAFIRDGVPFNDIPISVISRKTQTKFEIITTGYFTTSRIENILDQNL
jgi:hypothetical protein